MMKLDESKMKMEMEREAYGMQMERTRSYVCGWDLELCRC